MAHVAVHIVTYNSAQHIDIALEALAQQAGNWCVQIVDNASTDDTCERIVKWGYPLLVNKQNLGYAAAHNQALALTESDYILTLNPDVQLQADFIVEMIAAIQDRPEVGMIAGCLLRVDNLRDTPVTVDSAGIYLMRNRRQGLYAEGISIAERPQKLAYVFGVDGASAFYRRAMLEDISMDGEIFDPNFFMHKEDIDICWRAQWRAWKAIYTPHAIAHHVRTFRPGQRQGISPLLRYYSLRNRYVLMLKNEHRVLFVRDFLWIVFYEIQIWIYVLLCEPFALKIPFDIIRNWQHWLSKRRSIYITRKVLVEELDQWFYQQSVVIKD